MSLEEFKKFTQIRPAMDFIGATPDYGPQITVLMGSRPNEPIHRGHIGAIGHVMAVSPPPGPPVLASAHAILAGLDAAGGMAFAPKFGKPGLAHLNGQNGCRYGQDKRFGVENLRGAVNLIQALCGHNYGANGEMVGLDIKAMDTRNPKDQCRRIQNSMQIATMPGKKAAKFHRDFQARRIALRNHEALEMYVMELLMQGQSPLQTCGPIPPGIGPQSGSLAPHGRPASRLFGVTEPWRERSAPAPPG